MKKSEKKKKKSRIGLIILIIILLILGISGGIFAYKVNKQGGGVEGAIAVVLGHDEETVNNLDTFYCVLLGQSQNLTDTIMLAAYCPKTQKASLLSVPRDTFVGKSRSNASPYDKINALCQYTHPEKTTAAVAEITGINVDKYILIDTKALVQAVDLIGGVYFDVPVDMFYNDTSQDLYINVDAGYQLLDGDKAEQVVRFRHNDDGTSYPDEYGKEDIGRSKTQRAFLLELAKQTLQPQNIFKIGEFLDIFYENVKTNITIDEIKDYIPYIVKMDMERIKTGIVPGTPEMINSYAFYTHNKKETAEVVEELFANIESFKDNVKIEILNGTGDATVAETIQEKLKEIGYKIISSTETTMTARTSLINRNGKDEDINEIKDILGTGIRTLGETESEADITIILGRDYLNKEEKDEGN